MTKHRYEKRPGEECWDVYLGDEWIGSVTHTGPKHWTPRDTDGNPCGPMRAAAKHRATTFLLMHYHRPKNG